MTAEELALKWEAPRRLSQLRGELHDRIKFTDLSAYKATFDDAPFARAGGPSGTTSRLSTWLSRLATSINHLEVTPAIAALTLTFLHAPQLGALHLSLELLTTEVALGRDRRRLKLGAFISVCRARPETAVTWWSASRRASKCLLGSEHFALTGLAVPLLQGRILPGSGIT